MTWLVILQRGAFGMIFSASDTAIMRTLPVPDRNVGAGLHNMHRGIAMAFGVALCSVLLEKRFALHQLLYANAHDGFALPVQETFTALRDLLSQAGEARHGAPAQALAALASLLTEQARLAAYQDCFLLIGICFLVSLLPAWWSRTQRPRPSVLHASRETESVQGAAMVPDAAVQTASRV
jgi:DHA2 family multidrug resistance protein